MSDLSEAARALIRDGQSVLRPSLDDRSRVASALASKLGEGGLVASSAAAGAASRWLAWQKLSVLAVGLGVSGLGATWALKGEPGAAAPPPAVVAAPVLAEVTPPPEPVAPPVVEERAPEPAPKAPAVAKAPTDRLAEEVALLSKATTELRAGRPAEALRLLNEHQRAFPVGRLVEERRAARIQALCALGSRAAAESELSRLARSSPRSPHLVRAQQACGFPKTGG